MEEVCRVVLSAAERCAGPGAHGLFINGLAADPVRHLASDSVLRALEEQLSPSNLAWCHENADDACNLFLEESVPLRKNPLMSMLLGRLTEFRGAHQDGGWLMVCLACRLWLRLRDALDSGQISATGYVKDGFALSRKRRTNSSCQRLQVCELLSVVQNHWLRDGMHRLMAGCPFLSLAADVGCWAHVAANSLKVLDVYFMDDTDPEECEEAAPWPQQRWYLANLVASCCKQVFSPSKGCLLGRIRVAVDVVGCTASDAGTLSQSKILNGVVIDWQLPIAAQIILRAEASMKTKARQTGGKAMMFSCSLLFAECGTALLKAVKEHDIVLLCSQRIIDDELKSALYEKARCIAVERLSIRHASAVSSALQCGTEDSTAHHVLSVADPALWNFPDCLSRRCCRLHPIVVDGIHSLHIEPILENGSDELQPDPVPVTALLRIPNRNTAAAIVKSFSEATFAVAASLKDPRIVPSGGAFECFVRNYLSHRILFERPPIVESHCNDPATIVWRQLGVVVGCLQESLLDFAKLMARRHSPRPIDASIFVEHQARCMRKEINFFNVATMAMHRSPYVAAKAMPQMESPSYFPFYHKIKLTIHRSISEKTIVSSDFQDISSPPNYNSRQVVAEWDTASKKFILDVHSDRDAAKRYRFDRLTPKLAAIQAAVDFVMTVLRIDSVQWNDGKGKSTESLAKESELIFKDLS